MGGLLTLVALLVMVVVARVAILRAAIDAVLAERGFSDAQYKISILNMNAYGLDFASGIKVNAVTSATSSFKNFAGLADLKGQVPKGKIGNVEISRLIMGGNLIVGYAHARDLVYVSELIMKYNTQEKIWETFRLCEACGINSALMRTGPDILLPLQKYWKQGGKIQWLAAVYPKENDVATNTQLAIDSGASVVLYTGWYCRRLDKSGPY